MQNDDRHSVCLILVFKRVPEDNPSTGRNMLDKKFCNIRTF
jgi:hypothetical protein